MPDTVSLREHLESKIQAVIQSIVDFKSAIYSKFDAVYAKFDAVEKQTKIAFDASEKAREKAEIAQQGRNEMTNEFRGQLSDQAATLMPRKEVEGLINATNEKIESRFISLREEFGGRFDRIEQANATEKSRGDIGQGSSQGKESYTSRIITIISVLIALVLFIMRFVH
jgi:hypothetical protein